MPIAPPIVANPVPGRTLGNHPRGPNSVTMSPSMQNASPLSLLSGKFTTNFRKVRAALSNSFGFGGHNVTLAVRAWEGE